MICPACDAYRRNPLTGSFNPDCPECKTRLIALGPAFFEAMKADRLTPGYKALLVTELGPDWQERHQAVKAAYESHQARMKREAAWIAGTSGDKNASK